MTARVLRRSIVLCLVLLQVFGSSAFAIDITRYAWEYPRVTGVNGADPLIQRLQEEVQKVLDAGRLSPARTYYADIGTVEEYWQYIEPGRIITTLAWAFPYLTVGQQAAVRAYVAAELASATHAPWAPYPMQPTVGTRRELSPPERATYRTYGFGASRPSLHTVYGLWLYAFRSGDWATIQANWTAIKSLYGSRSSQGDIYGTMGAHVAMVRLADKFADAAMRSTALANLQTQLDSGINFATVESRASSKYWPEMYDARRATGVYQGWMFLNLSPEIGRYLFDQVKAATLARNDAGKANFPLWWLRQAGYFSRWTGDEGVGIPSEMMGMVMPVERWVVQANAATLRDYVRSGPTSLGDCYWLESLVQAIEATGTLVWADARSGAPVPPAAPTGVRIIQ
jgi:hypothetical protein